MSPPPFRLHPPVSAEAAHQWLREQAAATWGDERLPALDDALRQNAEAIAAVSSAALPDDLEPLFP